MAGDTDWRGFPFETPPHYFFYAGRESHDPAYGHMMDYGLHPAMAGFFDEDLAPYVQKATVAWTAEGVSFQEPSGHRLFIPRRAYEGGR